MTLRTHHARGLPSPGRRQIRYDAAVLTATTRSHKPHHSLQRQRGGRVLLGALALALALPATAYADLLEAQTGDPGTSGWWTPWYLVDYGLIAAGGLGYVGGQAMWPRDRAIIGPVYDPDDPTSVFEADSLQRALRDETVDLTALRVIMTAPGALLGGIEAFYWQRGDGSAQHFHDMLVGYAEAVAITSGITAITQGSFGRLRPDFGERARNYHCSIEPEAYGEYCAGFRDAPLSDEHGDPEHLLRDGRRGFFSGHAAHAFNGFGYASLALGSRYVWGPNATPTSRAAAISGQAAMLGLGTYIAASRATDARHQTSDVIAGSLVGIAVANATYWRRFHADGTPRRASRDGRGYSLRLTPAAVGTGLALTIEH